MQVGKMNRRILILKRIVKPSDAGFTVDSWEITKSIWAMVKPLRARDLTKTTKLNSDFIDKYITFYVRWTNNITVVNRIEFEGKQYTIMDLVDIGNKRGWLEITAREVVNNGDNGDIF